MRGGERDGGDGEQDWFSLNKQRAVTCRIRPRPRGIDATLSDNFFACSVIVLLHCLETTKSALSRRIVVAFSNLMAETGNYRCEYCKKEFESHKAFAMHRTRCRRKDSKEFRVNMSRIKKLKSINEVKRNEKQRRERYIT